MSKSGHQLWVEYVTGNLDMNRIDEESRRKFVQYGVETGQLDPGKLNPAVRQSYGIKAPTREAVPVSPPPRESSFISNIPVAGPFIDNAYQTAKANLQTQPLSTPQTQGMQYQVQGQQEAPKFGDTSITQGYLRSALGKILPQQAPDMQGTIPEVVSNPMQGFQPQPQQAPHQYSTAMTPSPRMADQDIDKIRNDQKTRERELQREVDRIKRENTLQQLLDKRDAASIEKAYKINGQWAVANPQQAIRLYEAQQRGELNSIVPDLGTTPGKDGGGSWYGQEGAPEGYQHQTAPAVSGFENRPDRREPGTPNRPERVTQEMHDFRREETPAALAGFMEGGSLGLARRGDPDFFQGKQEDSPLGYMAGDIVGTVMGMSALGGLAPVLKGAPPIVQRAVTSAGIGGLSSAARAVGHEKDDEVLKEAVRGAIYFGTGSVASTYTKAAGIKLLSKIVESHPEASRWAAAGLAGVSGAAFATVGTISSMMMYGEDEKPTREEIIQRAVTMGLFAATMSMIGGQQWNGAKNFVKLVDSDKQKLTNEGWKQIENGVWAKTDRSGKVSQMIYDVTFNSKGQLTPVAGMTPGELQKAAIRGEKAVSQYGLKITSQEEAAKLLQKMGYTYKGQDTYANSKNQLITMVGKGGGVLEGMPYTKAMTEAANRTTHEFRLNHAGEAAKVAQSRIQVDFARPGGGIVTRNSTIGRLLFGQGREPISNQIKEKIYLTVMKNKALDNTIGRFMSVNFSDTPAGNYRSSYVPNFTKPYGGSMEETEKTMKQSGFVEELPFVWVKKNAQGAIERVAYEYAIPKGSSSGGPSSRLFNLTTDGKSDWFSAMRAMWMIENGYVSLMNRNQTVPEMVKGSQPMTAKFTQEVRAMDEIFKRNPQLIKAYNETVNVKSHYVKPEVLQKIQGSATMRDAQALMEKGNLIDFERGIEKVIAAYNEYYDQEESYDVFSKENIDSLFKMRSAMMKGVVEDELIHSIETPTLLGYTQKDDLKDSRPIMISILDVLEERGYGVEELKEMGGATDLWIQTGRERLNAILDEAAGEAINKEPMTMEEANQLINNAYQNIGQQSGQETTSTASDEIIQPPEETTKPIEPMEQMQPEMTQPQAQPEIIQPEVQPEVQPEMKQEVEEPVQETDKGVTPWTNQPYVGQKVRLRNGVGTVEEFDDKLVKFRMESGGLMPIGRGGIEKMLHKDQPTTEPVKEPTTEPLPQSKALESIGLNFIAPLEDNNDWYLGGLTKEQKKALKDIGGIFLTLNRARFKRSQYPDVETLEKAILDRLLESEMQDQGYTQATVHKDPKTGEMLDIGDGDTTESNRAELQQETKKIIDFRDASTKGKDHLPMGYSIHTDDPELRKQAEMLVKFAENRENGISPAMTMFLIENNLDEAKEYYELGIFKDKDIEVAVKAAKLANVPALEAFEQWNNELKAKREAEYEAKLITFKATVKDKETGNKTVIESKHENKTAFIKDLRSNGYTVNPNHVKPAEVWDWIVDNTNAQELHWEAINAIPENNDELQAMLDKKIGLDSSKDVDVGQHKKPEETKPPEKEEAPTDQTNKLWLDVHDAFVGHMASFDLKETPDSQIYNSFIKDNSKVVKPFADAGKLSDKAIKDKLVEKFGGTLDNLRKAAIEKVATYEYSDLIEIDAPYTKTKAEASTGNRSEITLKGSDFTVVIYTDGAPMGSYKMDFLEYFNARMTGATPLYGIHDLLVSKNKEVLGKDSGIPLIGAHAYSQQESIDKAIKKAFKGVNFPQGFIKKEAETTTDTTAPERVEVEQETPESEDSFNIATFDSLAKAHASELNKSMPNMTTLNQIEYQLWEELLKLSGWIEQNMPKRGSIDVSYRTLPWLSKKPDAKALARDIDPIYPLEGDFVTSMEKGDVFTTGKNDNKVKYEIVNITPKGMRVSIDGKEKMFNGESDAFYDLIDKWSTDLQVYTAESELFPIAVKEVKNIVAAIQKAMINESYDKFESQDREGSAEDGQIPDVLGQSDVGGLSDPEGTTGVDHGTDVDSTRRPGGRSTEVRSDNDQQTDGTLPLQQSQSGPRSGSTSQDIDVEGSTEVEGTGTADAAGDSVQGQPGLTESDVDGDTGILDQVPGPDGTRSDGDSLAIQNYRINTEDSVFTKGGKKTRYKANIKALKTLETILDENRPATKEEQADLAQFSGWGALSEAFDRRKEGWEKEFEEVKEVLQSLETKHFKSYLQYGNTLYDYARDGMLNAHFTSPKIINAVYEGLKHLGFKKGAVLEPSMGIGNFYGAMPSSVMNHSRLYGVEIDPITAKIAQLLYPGADIRISGFEKVEYPNNYFDVAIGNVPFGTYKVYDNTYPNGVTERIHNYFFAKALDKVKPGGVVAFITSTGTMDSKSENLREYLSDKARLIGAFKLPGNTFKDNAGTQVTTDLLFFQKLAKGEVGNKETWNDLAEIQIGDNVNGYETFTVNRYFDENPDSVIGSFIQDTLHQGRVGVKSDLDTDGIAKMLVEAMKKTMEPDVFKKMQTGTIYEIPDEIIEKAKKEFDGTVFVEENKAYQVINGKAVEIPAAKQAQVKAAYQLKELAKETIQLQRSFDANDDQINKKIAELKKSYDAYVKKHGHLLKRDRDKKGKLTGRTQIEKDFGTSVKVVVTDTKGKKVTRTTFVNDPELYLLQSLEIERVTIGDDEKDVQVMEPSLILTTRAVKPPKQYEKVESAQEGIIASFNTHAHFDMDYVVSLYGKSEEAIVKELGDAIYLNPTGDWETSDDYLSGNVREKLREAQEAAKMDNRYARNVEALEAVIPEKVPYAKIDFNTGDSWIPKDIQEKALAKYFGFNMLGLNLDYDKVNNEWRVKLPKTFTPQVNTFMSGISSMSLNQVVKAAMQNTNVVVKYKVNRKQYVDEKQTNLVRAKIKDLRKYLKTYGLDNPDVLLKIEELYNNSFNAIIPRDYEKVAELFEFSNINPNVTLRPWQKIAIVRSIVSGNTLLAHGVGAGKTFEEIGIAMESKRLGLANKPVLVVPNHKLSDFANDAKLMYPDARILALDQDEFKAENIKRTLALAAVNDWDMVIIRHSNFTALEASPQIMIPAVQKEIRDYEELLEEMRSQADSKLTAKKIQDKIKKLREKLHHTTNDKRKYEGMLYFEDIGFDLVIVDEAHSFKNAPVIGKYTDIKGMQIDTSGKARDMMMKLEYIRGLHNQRRGVVFGTGTPIMNSIAEIYVMFKYLRPDILADAEISHFDAFIDTFSDVTSVTEISASGTTIKPMYRFKEFVNMYELSKMYREFTDVKFTKDLKLKLPDYEYIEVKADPHPELARLMKYIDSNWKAYAKVKKVFKLYNWMRIAPHDMRFVMSDAEDFPTSKLQLVVQNVMKEYKEHEKHKGLQIVFMDRGRSTSNDFDGSEAKEFSLWKAVKDELVSRGIPDKEIVIIDKDVPDKNLEDVYRKANAGKIRVLIGTYQKLGVGVNVQKRLFATHEIDTPYRPADIEQAEGRQIRQGNMAYELGIKTKIYRYVTISPEGAFSGDAKSWQDIHNKVKAFNAFLKGDPNVRKISAMDDEAQSAAEMKAIAMNDERWFRKSDLEAQFEELSAERTAHLSATAQARRQVEAYKDAIRVDEDRLRYLGTAFKQHTKDLNEQAEKQALLDEQAEQHKKDVKQLEEDVKAGKELSVSQQLLQSQLEEGKAAPAEKPVRHIDIRHNRFNVNDKEQKEKFNDAVKEIALKGFVDSRKEMIANHTYGTKYEQRVPLFTNAGILYTLNVTHTASTKGNKFSYYTSLELYGTILVKTKPSIIEDEKELIEKFVNRDYVSSWDKLRGRIESEIETAENTLKEHQKYMKEFEESSKTAFPKQKQYDEVDKELYDLDVALGLITLQDVESEEAEPETEESELPEPKYTFNQKLNEKGFDYTDKVTETLETSVREAMPAAERAPSKIKQKVDAVQRVIEIEKGTLNKPRIVANSIAHDLITDGKTNFIGKHIKNMRELAAAAEVFRNPMFETLRIIYVKDGKVVMYDSITSRIAHKVEFSPQEVISTARTRFHQLKADGFYILHNHPTGNPVASPQDKEATMVIHDDSKMFDLNFLGHVVIDHDKYSELTIKAKPGKHNMFTPLEDKYELKSEVKSLDKKGVDPLRTFDSHPVLGIEVKNMVGIALAMKTLERIGDPLKDKMVTLLFMDAEDRISGIMEIPHGMLNDKRNMKNFLKKRAVEFGSSYVTAVSSMYSPRFAEYMEEGLFYDVAAWKDNQIALVSMLKSGPGLGKKGSLFSTDETRYSASLRQTFSDFRYEYNKEGMLVDTKTGQVYEKPDAKEDLYHRLHTRWLGTKDIALERHKAESLAFEKEAMKLVGEERVGKKTKELLAAINVYIDLLPHDDGEHDFLAANPEAKELNSEFAQQQIDKHYDSLTSEQQAIVDRSQNLSLKEQALAQAIIDSARELSKDALEFGVIRNVMENYIARHWVIPRALQKKLEGKAKFRTTSKHAQKRTLDSILHGWAEGYKLKYEGAHNAMRAMKDDVARAIEDKRMVADLMTRKDATGKSIFATKHQEGYVELEHPNMKYWRVMDKVDLEEKELIINEFHIGDKVKVKGEDKVGVIWDAEGEDVFVRFGHGENRVYMPYTLDQLTRVYPRGKDIFIDDHGKIWQRLPLYARADVGKKLNNVLGRSLIEQMGEENPVFGVNIVKSVDTLNATLKSIVLTSALFHPLAVSRSWIYFVHGSKVGFRSPTTAYKEGTKLMEEMNPIFELGVRNGLTAGLNQDWNEEYARNRDTAFDDLMKKMGKLPSGAVNKLRDVWEKQNDFIFKKYIPGLKAMAFAIEFKKHMIEHPGTDPETAAQIVAAFVNDDFGGIHHGWAGTNKTALHVRRLALLGPDWTYSNLNTVRKAMFKRYSRDIEGGPDPKEFQEFYRRQWWKLLLKALATLIGLNWLLSIPDDETFLNRYKMAFRGSQGGFDGFKELKWAMVDITPLIKMHDPEFAGRKYFNVLGHILDPPKWTLQPLQSVKNKGSIFVSMAGEALTGSDWRGRRFTTFPELLGFDESGGLHKGKLTKYNMGGDKGAVGLGTLPSFAVHQLQGAMPIPVQQGINYLLGVQDGYDSMIRALGMQSTNISGERIEKWDVNKFKGKMTPIRRKATGLMDSWKEGGPQEHQDVQYYTTFKALDEINNRLNELNRKAETVKGSADLTKQQQDEYLAAFKNAEAELLYMADELFKQMK